MCPLSLWSPWGWGLCLASPVLFGATVGVRNGIWLWRTFSPSEPTSKVSTSDPYGAPLPPTRNLPHTLTVAHPGVGGVLAELSNNATKAIRSGDPIQMSKAMSKLKTVQGQLKENRHGSKRVAEQLVELHMACAKAHKA